MPFTIYGFVLEAIKRLLVGVEKKNWEVLG